MPSITALYASLIALLILGLALRVVMMRRRFKIGIGAGGKHELDVAIRCHANAIEYMPIALILLGLVEHQGLGAAWVHIGGATLFISRVLHAQGLTSTQGGVSFGRYYGTLAAWLSIICLAFANIGFYLVGSF